jgi:hypothetical protein
LEDSFITLSERKNFSTDLVGKLERKGELKPAGVDESTILKSVLNKI